MNKMEIKKLIIFFLKEVSKPLGRTELMKYVYLFEYYYYQKYKKQYTNLVFNRYKFGPNHSEVIEAIDDLAAEGIINVNAYENYYGSISYSHTLNFNDFSDIPQYDLADKEREVASYIADKLRNKNYRGVLSEAYNTPPMKEILEEERKSGFHFYGRVIDMSKSKPIFKSSRQARKLARDRLSSQQQSRGSDDDYYAHLLEQYRNYEDTRRRVNFVRN